jgi:hypothetical protein
MSTYSPVLSYGAATRVVLVATSSCPNDQTNLPDLPQVKNNIEELQRIFVDSSTIGLPSSSVVTILDVAESSEVATLIDKAASEATDTLIVYYAGHGLYGDAHASLYLTSKNTTSKHKPSAINVDLVRQAMSRSAAKKRILILDCCYSGRALTGAMADSDGEVSRVIDLIGTYGIAAVPGDHKALAPPGEIYTKFSGALISVLKEGIQGPAEVLTVDDVFNAVKSKIQRDASSELPQHSNWNEGGKFKFAINRYVRDKDVQVLQSELATIRARLNEQSAEIKRMLDCAVGTNQLAERLEVLEAALKPVRLEVSEQTSEVGLWSKVGISRALWDELEADPFKINIQKYFSAKRDVRRCFGAWTVLFILSVIACFVSVPERFALVMDRVAFILSSVYVVGTISLIALAVLLLREDFEMTVSLSPPRSPAVRAELETNLKLHEAITSNVAFLFGFWFDVGSVITSLAFNALGLCAIGFVIWLSGVWRVPFHSF